MKRITVLCLVIAVLLLVFVGCEQADINPNGTVSKISQESENTYEEEMDDITESAQNSSAEETQSVQEAPNNGSEQQENDKSIDNSIQTKQYQYFYRSVEENPYDKWLKNELEKGERAEKTIYAEYLAYWKDGTCIYYRKR